MTPYAKFVEEAPTSAERLPFWHECSMSHVVASLRASESEGPTLAALCCPMGRMVRRALARREHIAEAKRTMGCHEHLSGAAVVRT
jgi:hypothetical protein